MVNSVTQKFDSAPVVSHSLTYKTRGGNKKQPAAERTFKDTLKENQSNILASGLFTAGALLIYLGIRRPGTAEVLNKFINDRVEDMTKTVNDYCSQMSVYVASSFQNTAAHILDFRSSRIMNPATYLSHITSENNPTKLLHTQDKIFENIARKMKRAGASDMDSFSGEFIRELKKVTGEIHKRQGKTELILDDFTALPERTKLKKDILKVVEGRLNSERRNLADYMNRVRDTKLNEVSTSQYAQMADAIRESRISKTRTKELMLDTTFQKVREGLGLGEDFVPGYNLSRYELTSEELSKDNLTRLSIPTDVLEHFEKNLFIETIMKKDLLTLSETELRDLYKRIPGEYNLKDLRYLIDRVRLHGVVSSANPDTKAQADIYKQMELRLKYLSDKLNDLGEKELLSSCKYDFENMRDTQRQAKLYYISLNSRRLGYEDFCIMNEDMLNKSEEYRKLEFPNFAKIIESNPERYFI